MDIKTFKQNLLNKLYEPYKNCTKCPLGLFGRKHVVLGEGNPDAQLMLIGEGPGRQEDLLNRPFIGRSGQLLDKALELAGLSRRNVFITNIVKCRPPNNRKPFLNESNICKKILLFKQIKIIRPKIICTLGSTAIETFLEKPSRITQIRGKKITKDEFTIMPTYHPAYILRNIKKLENFMADIISAKKMSKIIKQ